MTPDIALSKAYSAAVMQRPTEMLENWRNSDPVFFTQVGRMGQRPIVATKGGFTLKREGAILGGIGISGGSPDEDQLLAARAAGDAGRLAAAEEQAVVAALHMQRRLGLSAVGDGQFRREHFESVVYDHVDGFQAASGSQPLADAAGIPPARRRAAPDRPQARERLASAEAATVLAHVQRPVFVALPAPGYLAAAGAALAGPAALDTMRARGALGHAGLRPERSRRA